MKKLIFSILVLALTSGIAQSSESTSRILIDGGNQALSVLVQNNRLKAIQEISQKIDKLYKTNVQLNKELDILLLRNKKLKRQNIALKLRNKQLLKVDQVAVGQNIKLIRHNETLILKNDRKIVRTAWQVQENQDAIRANEISVEQQIRIFESFIESAK